MKPNKIALLTFHLNNGGLEKVVSNMSFMFSKNGFDTHIITLEDTVAYDFEGQLYNIGKRVKKYPKYVAKCYSFYLLYQYLQKHNFDFVIDYRYRLNPISEFFFSKIILPPTTIYTIHSAKLDAFLFKNRWLTHYFFQKKYKMVCVCKQLEAVVKNTYSLQNTTTIYNAIDTEKIKNRYKNTSKLFDFEYVIAIARLEVKENIKQIDQLIVAYYNSGLWQQNCHLVILGEGNQKSILMQLCRQLRIAEFVHFLGFQTNPYVYLHHALFLVLCSKHEGFPTVIIEALACEIPVIAFDLQTGPSEIIQHQKNGLLVENQNFEALTLAMQQFYNDKELYQYCKGYALASIHQFEEKEVINKWQKILNDYETSTQN